MEVCLRIAYLQTIMQILLFILAFVQCNSDLDLEIHALDKFIKETISCRNIPALSISLVRDGHIIMSRGYGHSDIEKQIKATEHSKFCVGSLTKAFTTTVLADILSNENRITLDTPIKAILGPCFRLSDDLLTNNVNLRDLMAHKVGTPPYFHALVVGFPPNTTRPELIRRLQYMPAAEPFRTKFKYSNYMYTLAGYVAELLSGKTWDNLVTEHLIEPLGMRSTGIIKREYLQEIVTPYTLKNGKLKPIDTELILAVSPSDPAGAIYSSASDMAKWMLFHLNNGRTMSGRRLVDGRWLNMTYEAQMWMPFSKKDVYRPFFPVADLSASYGLGWMSSVYRGYRKIWHSGGIVTYQSQLWLFPDKKSGVFVVISGPVTSNGSLAIKAVTSRAADVVLQEVPWLNSTTTCTLPEPWARKRKILEPNSDYLVFTWNISRSPYDYTGTYGHKGFGNLTVYAENNSSLFLLFGRFGKMHLQPISEERFSGYYIDKLWFFTGSDEHYVPIRMKFVMDQKTNATKAVLFQVDFDGLFTLFEKDLDFDWLSSRSDKPTSKSYCYSGKSSGGQESSIIAAGNKLIITLLSICYIFL